MIGQDILNAVKSKRLIAEIVQKESAYTRKVMTLYDKVKNKTNGFEQPLHIHFNDKEAKKKLMTLRDIIFDPSLIDEDYPEMKKLILVLQNFFK